MWPFGKSTNQRFNDAVQSTIEATNACFGPWMANGRLFNAMMTDPYVSCYVMSRMQGLALMTCRMDGVPDDVHQYVLDAAMTKLLGGQRNGRAYVEGAAKFKTDSSTRAAWEKGGDDGIAVGRFFMGTSDPQSHPDYDKIKQRALGIARIHQPSSREPSAMEWAVALETAQFGAYMNSTHPPAESTPRLSPVLQTRNRRPSI